MPQPTTPFDHELPAVEGVSATLAGWLRLVLLGPIAAAAFWAAIVLPFLHVPLLLSGLESGPEVTAFVLLVVLNGLAIIVGHPYRRD